MKKGQLSPVVYIILVLLGALVLILFLYNMSRAFDDIGAIEPCRLSIAALSSIQEATYGTVDLGLLCPVHRVELGEESGVIKVGEKKREITVVVDGEQTSHYGHEAKAYYQILARELRKCWYKTGAGKLDALGNPVLFPDADSRCLVCSELTPMPSLTDRVVIPDWNGFVTWMGTADVPGKDFTYKEYFENAVNWPDLLVTYDGEYHVQNTFDLSKPYVVLYVSDKRSDFIKMLSDEKFRNMLVVMPAEDAADFCGRIIYQLE